MANKTTTLKTQTGDNVYPNVLKENLPASAVFYGDEAAGPEGGVETPSGGESIKDLPVIELTGETTEVSDATIKTKILANINDNKYLICKLRLTTVASVEVLITRDTKVIPNDNTIATYSILSQIDLGIVAATINFILVINKDNTILVNYKTFDYVKDNHVSLVENNIKSTGLGITTDYGDTNTVNGNTFYFDTINGQKIYHQSDTDIVNHTIPEPSKAVPLYGNHNVLVPADSTDAAILPCTTADNGKVLSVVEGQAQWATPTGGVNGLTSDAEGNLTASKNLGVDGKLTLKSLISGTNPDGDITKELGGGPTAPARHAYRVLFDGSWYIAITSKDYGFKIGEKTFVPSDFLTNDKYKELRSGGIHPVGGAYNYTTIPSELRLQSAIGIINLVGYDITKSQAISLNISLDRISAIVQLN